MGIKHLLALDNFEKEKLSDKYLHHRSFSRDI
jgi:hypothetical protein